MTRPSARTTCLENAGYATLGEVVDGFGPHLLDHPKETRFEQRRREGWERYNASVQGRRGAVFEAANDGVRPFAEIAKHFGIKQHVARSDYYRERNRWLRAWWAQNPSAPMIDVPLYLSADLPRNLLRQLSQQGIAPATDARKLGLSDARKGDVPRRMAKRYAQREGLPWPL